MAQMMKSVLKSLPSVKQIANKFTVRFNYSYFWSDILKEIRSQVAIEGNIASGKTALVDYFAENPSVEVCDNWIE